MSEKLIKPYEISVWEDKLIQDGNEYKLIENKLAVIGSNTMTGLNRVYDPVFDKKANGEKTLDLVLEPSQCISKPIVTKYLDILFNLLCNLIFIIH